MSASIFFRRSDALSIPHGSGPAPLIAELTHFIINELCSPPLTAMDPSWNPIALLLAFFSRRLRWPWSFFESCASGSAPARRPAGCGCLGERSGSSDGSGLALRDWDYRFRRFFSAARFLEARARAARSSAGEMKARPRASSASVTTGASPRPRARTRALAAAEGGNRWGEECFMDSLLLKAGRARRRRFMNLRIRLSLGSAVLGSWSAGLPPGCPRR